MPVQFDEFTHAVAYPEQADPPRNGPAQGDSPGAIEFENALGQVMDSKPVPVAVSRESDPSPPSAHSFPEPVEYPFARGPGYGTGLGTRGYGSDDSPDDLNNSVSSEDSGGARYAFATGPGYGSGVGTMGCGGDSSAGPDDLAAVIPSSERVAQRYAAAAQLRHDSIVASNESGNDLNPGASEVEVKT